MITIKYEQSNLEQSYILVSDNKDMKRENEYLAHKKKMNQSPNTVKRIAHSLCYYFRFLDSINSTIEDVFDMDYLTQHGHFVDFLHFIKNGNHTTRNKFAKNVSCNLYLGDVLNYYKFLFLQYDNFHKLKVLRDSTMTVTTSVGITKKISGISFKGYLENDKTQGDSISEDYLYKLINSCTNIRDKLLIMMIADTGFRIGEILGIDYTSDIDYKKRTVRVVPRDKNQNYARAKYREARTGYLSNTTFQMLITYLCEYRTLLDQTTHLFIILKGEFVGQPMKVSSVYSFFKRLEKKTGIKTHPHAIRHYFATERWKSGWDILLISNALGHKSINTTINYLNIGSEELRMASEEYYENNEVINYIDSLI